VEEVVGRVDQFEGADERLASEVLADTALVKDIAQAESEEDRSEKIENAFISKARELIARLDEAASREAEIKRRLKRLRKQLQLREPVAWKAKVLSCGSKELVAKRRQNFDVSWNGSKPSVSGLRMRVLRS
jgi:hypothetical protein